MNVQNIIVYVLVTGAVAFLAFKFLRPFIKRKSREAKLAMASETSPKKDNCDNDCNCK